MLTSFSKLNLERDNYIYLYVLLLLMTKTDAELIRQYTIMGNRLNAYTTKAPLRYKVQTSEEMKAIARELASRGLYNAGNGRFVTVPEFTD